MGRIYSWLDTHPRTDPANAGDWAVANFLHDNGLDVRRPVILDVKDSSPAIVALNATATNLPGGIRYGEVVYERLPLGYLARIPIVNILVSVFDPPGPNVGVNPAPQLSAAARSFILNQGQPQDFRGDGLIQAANQVFTQFIPTARIVPRLIIKDHDVLHTEAPEGLQVTDMVARLRLVGPGWWP